MAANSSVREEVAAPLRLPEELLAKSGFLMVRLGMAYKSRAIAHLEEAGFSQYHYSLLALLDFESACDGAFAYDIMVTICAWCYSSRFEPALVEAFLQGYHAVRPIRGDELAALEVEGAVGCLRFATTRVMETWSKRRAN